MTDRPRGGSGVVEERPVKMPVQKPPQTGPEGVRWWEERIKKRGYFPPWSDMSPWCRRELEDVIDAMVLEARAHKPRSEPRAPLDGR